MKLNYKEHTFGMGHTIEAAIKLYNRNDLDENMMLSLVNIFNYTNKDAIPPKVGQTVKVPVFIGY